MVNNLAGNSDFRAAKEKMSARLMQELTRAKDPRMMENPPRFEQPPFTDAGEGRAQKKKGSRQRREHSIEKALSSATHPVPLDEWRG